MRKLIMNFVIEIIKLSFIAHIALLIRINGHGNYDHNVCGNNENSCNQSVTIELIRGILNSYLNFSKITTSGFRTH